MKEYKRCKFCSMEMYKSSIKCPHCKKVQTTNLFSKVKSENIIVMALVIVGILTCFYYNTFNLKNLKFNLDSLTDKFNNSEFFQNAFDGLENIDDFFSSDEDSDYENAYDPYYVEDIISDFEDDFDSALDIYDNTDIDLTGNITDFYEDDDSKYIYLNTGSDEYSLYICIPKSDSEDIDYIDSYDIGDEIFYSGTFYYDGDDDSSGTHYFSISDGYLE